MMMIHTMVCWVMKLCSQVGMSIWRVCYTELGAGMFPQLPQYMVS
jgi:hypothetical protein